MNTFYACIESISVTSSTESTFEAYVTSSDDSIALDIDVKVINNKPVSCEVVGFGQCLMFSESDSEEERELSMQKYREGIDQRIEENKPLYDKICDAYLKAFVEQVNVEEEIDNIGNDLGELTFEAQI